MTVILSLLMGGLVGLSLGFFGSGGSVLAVPILVYIIGLPVKEAIASSLIIVGVTAAVGALQKVRENHICYNVAVAFGSAGFVGAYTGAKLSVYLSGTVQLILFAVLMLLSAGSMLRKTSPTIEAVEGCQMNLFLSATLGLGVGVLTGLLGIGGGFLIVPALSVLGRLDIRLAMGTSLMVIAINAFSGAIGYVGLVDYDFFVIGAFIAASSVASFLGSKASLKFDAVQMKRYFAYFILTIGVLLLIKNLSGGW